LHEIPAHSGSLKDKLIFQQVLASLTPFSLAPAVWRPVQKKVYARHGRDLMGCPAVAKAMAWQGSPLYVNPFLCVLNRGGRGVQSPLDDAHGIDYF
jgi:hypothetical protein